MLDPHRARGISHIFGRHRSPRDLSLPTEVPHDQIPDGNSIACGSLPASAPPPPLLLTLRYPREAGGHFLQNGLRAPSSLLLIRLTPDAKVGAPVTCRTARGDHVTSASKGTVGTGKGLSKGLPKHLSKWAIFTVIRWNCRGYELTGRNYNFQSKCVCL